MARGDVVEATERDGALSPQKSYRTILQQEILAGLAEVKRPPAGLFLSSFSAGLNIGFSLLLMGVATTLFGPTTEGVLKESVLAVSYAAGFILVILGRSELFTEHTTLAVFPVLARRASGWDLTRVWGIVLVGNMLGAFGFAVLVARLTPALAIIEPWALEEIAYNMTRQPPWVMLASAVLAGWLMGELAWLLAASRDTISQVVCVVIVTTLIGFTRLHHIVVGTVEVLAGVLSGDRVGLSDFARFFVVTALGNAIGGVFFVAVIKFGHASRYAPHETEDAEERAASRAVDSTR